MKKILCAILAVTMLFCMAVPAFASNDVAVYISYNKGNNSNDGLSASTPKKSLGAAGGNGAITDLENGGYLVISEKFYVGADYTWKTRGEVTITANYGGKDYKNPSPENNPASGVMKFAAGKVFSVASDLVLDDVILFQEAAQNKIVVKAGANLTITDKIVTMTKQPYYMVIEVERGGSATINGGTFSAITRPGDITIGKNVKIEEGTTTPSTPAVTTGDVCFLSYSGSNSNSGLSPDQPKKGYTGGIFDVLTNGGTVVVVGKSYIAGTAEANEYTFKAFSKPLTFTSVYGGKDYKNAEPANNPACAFKMGSGTVLHISSDVIFDNIILFQENNQNTIHVKSGATLTVTDTVKFMSKPGSYHFKIVIDKGATAVLSEEAQETFTIENNGTLNTYVPEGGSATKPVEKIEVKLKVGSTTAYVNGKTQTIDSAPINRNNRVLLPVRFLANTFGVANEGIKWDAATRTATLTNNEVTIVVTIDAPSMTVNGKTVALDSPAIIENGRTYLPVRAIANALGVANENIKWDAATSTATLTK